MALASLEAEPVAYIFKHPAGKLFWALTDESNKEQSDVIPVYAAPPVPVVPEEKPMPNPIKMYAVDAVAAIAEVRGWNACRAAMLQSQGNCIKDGWISCSERMPNDKQYVWCWGKSYGWTECDTFEGYYDCSRNKWWAVTDDGEEPALKVTHWMPLPEPPQEMK
ncbi:bacteriophage protein [Escherichia coli]|nr:bacteriophage protein [Escherichia coli]